MEKQLSGNDRPLHLAKENDKTVLASSIGGVDITIFFAEEEPARNAKEACLSKRTVCRSNKSQSLLGGNLFCGHCGCRLVASRRTEKTVHKDGSVKERNYGIYVCYHRSRGLNDCDGATTYIADRVDKCVLQTVHEIFANIAGCPEEEKIQLAFKRSVEASRLEQLKLTEQIAKDEKQLDTLRAEIANALTGNSVYTSEDLSTAITAVRERIDESRERLKTLQDEEEQKKVMSDGIIPAYRRFRTWALEFDETSLEGKKMIINELFSRIELSKDYTLILFLLIALISLS